MGHLISTLLMLFFLVVLTGCPAKDWIKREDSYLSVEQYKNMTEVIRINDNLYRVKKGEELNQNGITQLFIDLQRYENSSNEQQKKAFSVIKLAYQSNKTALNVMTYVSVLLKSSQGDVEAYEVLSDIDYAIMRQEDKSLFNLARLLRGLLERKQTLVEHNKKLKKRIGSIKDQYELAREEVLYLNKQADELKAIEESLHAREVGIDLESR